MLTGCKFKWGQDKEWQKTWDWLSVNADEASDESVAANLHAAKNSMHIMRRKVDEYHGKWKDEKEQVKTLQEENEKLRQSVQELEKQIRETKSVDLVRHFVLRMNLLV